MKPTTEILARISQNSLANKEEVCRNGKFAQNIGWIFELQTLRLGGVSTRNHVK